MNFWITRFNNFDVPEFFFVLLQIYHQGFDCSFHVGRAQYDSRNQMSAIG